MTKRYDEPLASRYQVLGRTKGVSRAELRGSSIWLFFVDIMVETDEVVGLLLFITAT